MTQSLIVVSVSNGSATIDVLKGLLADLPAGEAPAAPYSLLAPLPPEEEARTEPVEPTPDFVLPSIPEQARTPRQTDPGCFEIKLKSSLGGTLPAPPQQPHIQLPAGAQHAVARFA